MVEIKTPGTSETLEPWLAASQLGVTRERMQLRDNKVTARRPRAADERPPHETAPERPGWGQELLAEEKNGSSSHPI